MPYQATLQSIGIKLPETKTASNTKKKIQYTQRHAPYRTIGASRGKVGLEPSGEGGGGGGGRVYRYHLPLRVEILNAFMPWSRDQHHYRSREQQQNSPDKSRWSLLKKRLKTTPTENIPPIRTLRSVIKRCLHYRSERYSYFSRPWQRSRRNAIFFFFAQPSIC